MKSAELLRKCRRIINPPYSSKNLLVIFGTLIILVSIPLTVVAVRNAWELRTKAVGENTIYLSPGTQSIQQGNTFTVQVRENSVSQQVNVVQSNLVYDAAKLDFVSIDTSASAFDWTLDNTGGSGLVKIGRGVMAAPGYVTGDQLIATVTFRAKFSPGTTSITFTADSKAANGSIDVITTTTPGTYTVFDPPPTVSLTSPANNSTIKGTVTATANANDDHSLTKVEFYVDSTLKCTVTVSPFQCSIDTTNPVVADGSHAITAKAYDGVNAAVTSTPVNVIVDNNAPTVSISSPTAGSYVKGTVTITPTYLDTVGVTKMEFYIDGSLANTDMTSPFSYPWDTTTATNTSHALFAKAYDNAGNVGTSATVNVTVDNVLPSATLTYPTAGAYLKTPFTMTATASDTNGITKVEFYIDSALKCTDTTSAYTCDVASATDGSHPIYTKAYDPAGNVVTTSTISIVVDNTAPTAPAGLTPSVVSATQINLAWIASIDATSGIAGYDVYRGGTKINTALITTTSYNDTGLTPATLYSYYVKATDKAGNVSAASNTATATTLRTADLNGDGTVNVYDLSTLLTRWGTSNAAADLNGNGAVDILDIGVLIPLLVI